jgi:hypothetical protein
MSTDYFAHGAWGIVLSEHEAIDEAYKKFSSAMEEAEEKYDEEEVEIDDSKDDFLHKAAQKHLRAIVAEVTARIGAPPPKARLLWTGSEDDQPGRCNTGGNEWILGVGMLRDPRKPLEVSNAFAKVADWHTWVTAG